MSNMLSPLFFKGFYNLGLDNLNLFVFLFLKQLETIINNVT